MLRYGAVIKFVPAPSLYCTGRADFQSTNIITVPFRYLRPIFSYPPLHTTSHELEPSAHIHYISHLSKLVYYELGFCTLY